MDDSLVTIDEYWLTFAVSVLLPMIVAAVTRRFSAGAVKSLVLLLLAIVAGWLTSLQATGGEFELKAAVTAMFVSFITAVGFHYGLLKPTGVTGDNGAIMQAAPGGIGAATPNNGDLRSHRHGGAAG